MSNTSKDEKVDRLESWQKSWDKRSIKFHQPIVNKVLKKHLSTSDTKEAVQTVFVPLCGKTLDMKWLADEGYTIVGVDGVKMALEEFFMDHGFDWTEKAAPKMGPDCKVLENKEGNIRLYYGDILLYNLSVESQFDAIWDRASLVAMNRDDVQRYVNVIEAVLSPGGRMILETVEYDISIMEDVPETPPPFPMYEAEVKSLFDSNFSVEFLERADFCVRGKDVQVAYYKITKNK